VQVPAGHRLLLPYEPPHPPLLFIGVLVWAAAAKYRPAHKRDVMCPAVMMPPYKTDSFQRAPQSKQHKECCLLLIIQCQHDGLQRADCERLFQICSVQQCFNSAAQNQRHSAVARHVFHLLTCPYRLPEARDSGVKTRAQMAANVLFDELWNSHCSLV